MQGVGSLLVEDFEDPSLSCSLYVRQWCLQHQGQLGMLKLLERMNMGWVDAHGKGKGTYWG